MGNYGESRIEVGEHCVNEPEVHMLLLFNVAKADQSDAHIALIGQW